LNINFADPGLLATTASQRAFTLHLPWTNFTSNGAWRVLALLDFKRITFANLATVLILHCNFTRAL
jgi:hypothetical protein